MTDNERVKPADQSGDNVEWRLTDCNRIVIRYKFASRQWSDTVEPYDHSAGTFGEVRELSQAEMQTIRNFFDLVLE